MNPIVYSSWYYGDDPAGTELPPNTLQGIASFPQEEKKPDMVNHPAHYNTGSIECIDAMEQATKHLSGAQAIATSQIIKYVWRWKHKNKPKEDLLKAKWYLERLIASLP